MEIADKYQATWLTEPMENYVMTKQDGGFAEPDQEIDGDILRDCQRNINGNNHEKNIFQQ